MEKIRIQCQHCSSRFAVAESAIGKKMRCPKCQGVIVVAAIQGDGGQIPKQPPEPTIPANRTKPQTPSVAPILSDVKKQTKQATSSKQSARVDSPPSPNGRRKPDPNTTWCYQIMGEVLGPISSSELLQQFETARLDLDTLVRDHRDEDWHRLEDCLVELRSTPPIPPPIPTEPVEVRERRNSATVEQLDNTLFLVEDLPLEEVFHRLKNAAGQNHTITGAFSRSGLIRGTGASGISFAITVKQTDEGVTFLLDGETPEGPTNFGALFDPTSGEGWGLLAATSLFNSAVNSTSANSVATDVRTLLLNLLTAFDAQHLLLGDEVKPIGVPGNLSNSLPTKNQKAPTTSFIRGLGNDIKGIFSKNSTAPGSTAPGSTAPGSTAPGNSPMVTIGVLLLIAGGIAVFTTLGMDTSVETDSGRRVHNIGLMQQQTNYLIVSFGILGIGLTLLLVGLRKPR
jgi:predicted Zn finger-like uncharacterized protein